MMWTGQKGFLPFIPVKMVADYSYDGSHEMWFLVPGPHGLHPPTRWAGEGRVYWRTSPLSPCQYDLTNSQTSKTMQESTTFILSTTNMRRWCQCAVQYGNCNSLWPQLSITLKHLYNEKVFRFYRNWIFTILTARSWTFRRSLCSVHTTPKKKKQNFTSQVTVLLSAVVENGAFQKRSSTAESWFENRG